MPPVVVRRLNQAIRYRPQSKAKDNQDPPERPEPRSGLGWNECSAASHRMPKRDVRRACEERAGSVDEGLDVRLLHMRSQENLLAGPMLNKQDARGITRVLEHVDAAAIWLDRLDRCNEGGDLTLGGFYLVWLDLIADDYDCSVHVRTRKTCFDAWPLGDVGQQPWQALPAMC